MSLRLLMAGLVLAAATGCQGPPLTDALDGAPGSDGAPAADALPRDADPGTAAPIAWYPMNDAPAGGVVPDVIGPHDATCAPCPTLTEGQIAGALGFAGDGDALRVADRADLRGPTGTLAMWVAPAATDTAMVFAAKPLAGGGHSFVLSQRPGGVAALDIAGGGHRESAAGALAAGRWTHLAMWWTPEQVAFYVDGGRVGRALAGPLSWDASDLTLAGDQDPGAPAAPLTGDLDDVRIYPRRLTDVEINILGQGL